MPGNPIGLKKGIDEWADPAKAIDSFDRPVWNAQIIPGFHAYTTTMPGGIQSVGAIEHTQIIRLAPDNHLPPETKRQWNLGKFDIAIRLTEDTFKTKRVGRTRAEVGKAAIAPRLAAIGKYFLARTG